MTPEEKAENLKLRELLWLGHGCQGLYGDDGEMQCGECRIDFLRQPAHEIEATFQRKALEKLKAANTFLFYDVKLTS